MLNLERKKYFCFFLYSFNYVYIEIYLQNDRLHKSPKPAPRKLSPSNRSSLEEAEFSPKHFHGQKPDPSQKNGILTAPMIVPAIGNHHLLGSYCM